MGRNSNVFLVSAVNHREDDHYHQHTCTHKESGSIKKINYCVTKKVIFVRMQMSSKTTTVNRDEEFNFIIIVWSS